MAVIGNFFYDPEHDTYSGDIVTLTFQRECVELRPNQKSSDREPDYRIVHEEAGGITEFGAAWKRQSDQGRPFLSVFLDDPALPAAIYGALFPAEHDLRARLVWQRKKEESQPSARNESGSAPAKERGGAQAPRRERRSSTPRAARFEP